MCAKRSESGGVVSLTRQLELVGVLAVGIGVGFYCSSCLPVTSGASEGFPPIVVGAEYYFYIPDKSEAGDVRMIGSKGKITKIGPYPWLEIERAGNLSNSSTICQINIENGHLLVPASQIQ